LLCSITKITKLLDKVLQLIEVFYNLITIGFKMHLMQVDQPLHSKCRQCL